MRVLVAMSGGVDSSVAAARLVADGHEVVGVTMKLWAGPSDSGCCSVADVEDARRVAQQLGLDHHVFDFSEAFERDVVEPYVADHAAGATPNPCVECNRHLKFDRLLLRAHQLGFDAVATGHHARVVRDDEGWWRVARGADAAKDQSYVVHMLDQDQLARVLFPVGAMTKAQVRAEAEAAGLRTATKPDSQDVCFISATGGRAAFLGTRIPLRPGTVVDAGTGATVGAVDAVELVTVGQRRGLGAAGTRRYALAVDTERGVVSVGDESALLTTTVDVRALTWSGPPLLPGAEVLVQVTAHGTPVPGRFEGTSIALDLPVRRVAPGQSVVLYRDDLVLGGGRAC